MEPSDQPGTWHSVDHGGVTLRVFVAGQGPLVILMHGWPELGLSWRHQIAPLAAAGFTVAVPDMRGYGASDKPSDPADYRLDILADDMAAVAASLGAARWVAVGHDWGAILAWRCALRFPDQVAAVFCLSVPHSAPLPAPFLAIIDHLYPDSFFYMRYFQEPGVAEAEFGADPAAALKRVYFMGSADGVRARTGRHVPRDSAMLPGLDDPPAGPLAFLSDAELAQYAAAFAAGGFQGPFNWYRNFDRNSADAAAYGDNVIRQPAGFLAGSLDMVLFMFPGMLENQRALIADLRAEILVPGGGHWIQQECPEATNTALLAFLCQVRDRL